MSQWRGLHAGALAPHSPLSTKTKIKKKNIELKPSVQQKNLTFEKTKIIESEKLTNAKIQAI